MKFIILMGAPGAGKGTQAKKLEETTGLPQVATGDLFRYNLEHETELGNLAQTYMDEGKLVPDKVTVAMVKERLSQPDCADGVILDGFPRTIAQAEALDEMLDGLGGYIDVVIYIEVDTEVLVDRLLKRADKEGRADDNEETIRTRMRVYREQTQPLLDYYQERDLLVRVNGDRSISAVHEEIKAVVEARE